MATSVRATLARPAAATLVAMAALAAPVTAAPPPEELAFFSGIGAMSPGVPPTGCVQQSVSFGGEGTVFPLGGAAHQGGDVTVRFDGAGSVCASLTADAGGGTLSGDITGSVGYVRTGNVMRLDGNVTYLGAAHTLDGGCWLMGTFAPGTSFRPFCWLTLDH